MIALTLAASLVLQILAATLALRLIRVTGRRAAWLFIAIGIALMSVRRAISLYRLLSGDPAHQPDLSAEAVALVISIVMLIGVALIASIFRELRRSEQILLQDQAGLEKRVVERTEELSSANRRLKAEVVEREHAEESLRVSEDKFRSLCAAAPIGIFLTDAQGQTIYTNQFLQRLTLLSEDEARGWGWHKVVHPDDRERVAGDTRQTAEEGTEFSGEFRLLTQDGVLRWVDVQTATMRDADGSILGKVGAVRDTTDRRLAEQDLMESSEKLSALAEDQHTLLQHTRDFLFRHDKDGVFTYLSPSVEQVTGYTLEEWKTHYTTYMTDNPANKKVITYTEETLRTGEESPPYSVEIFHKDGHKVMIEVSERAYFEEGRVAGIIGVARDVTDRHLAEEALRESEQRLQGIMDYSPAVIYMKDTNGRYLLINRRFEELFHTTLEQVLGKTDMEVFPAKAAEAFSKNDRKVLDGAVPIEFEEIAPHDDGPHTYVSLKFPLIDAAGIPLAVCGISTDISERKRAGEAMERAKEAAEAANRAKSTFLANVSHEIRTPIMAMLGAAELFAETTGGRPTEVHHRDVILRNGRHLVALIEDLLDLSRAEAGKLEVNRQNCSLVDILTDVQAMVDPLEKKPDVDLEFICDGKIPTSIYTDQTRVKQALINLINNSLKFTQHGYVRLHISVSQDSDGATLAVVVEDTGTGIEPDQLERIFEAFTQLSPPTGHVASGVGLGLPLVKWIAEQLGGSVHVQSELGQGSQFTMNIPIGRLNDSPWVDPPDWSKTGPQPDQTLPSASRQTRLHGKILVAEDYRDTRDLIRMALVDQGITVTTANNGRDAVEVGLAESFDLILLDIRMPEMDGIEAVGELRRKGCLTPIIALTAAGAGDRQQILDAGFDDLWPKPISLHRLIDACAAYLETEPVETEHSNETDRTEDKSEGAKCASSLKSRLDAAIQEFARNLPKRVGMIRSSVQEGDVDRTEELLHNLAGAGGIHGFMEVSVEAARLLQLARNGTLPDNPHELETIESLAAQAKPSSPNEETGRQASVPD